MHPEGANSMAVSWLRGRKVLVGTGRAISINFGINGLESRVSISSIHRPFFSYGRLLPFLRPSYSSVCCFQYCKRQVTG